MWFNYDTGILLGYADSLHTPEAIASLTKFGLGMKRNLTQLIHFTGIDTKKKKVFANRCVDLCWVPFEFDDDPLYDSSDAWGFAQEIRVQGSGIPLMSGSKISRPPIVVDLSLKQEVKEERKDVKSRSSDASHLALLKAQQQLDHVSPTYELWWIFQLVDVAVDEAIRFVDSKISTSTRASTASPGMLTVQVLLILAPVLLFVYYLAIAMLSSSSSSSSASTRSGTKTKD